MTIFHPFSAHHWFELVITLISLFRCVMVDRKNNVKTNSNIKGGYILATEKGKLIGYTDEECKNCGRLRVELWENGDKVCEKCNWNQDRGEYDFAMYK